MWCRSHASSASRGRGGGIDVDGRHRLGGQAVGVLTVAIGEDGPVQHEAHPDEEHEGDAQEDRQATPAAALATK